MDSVQFAGHVQLSELANQIIGTYGPFRGVVWRGTSGRYTRTWLTNGYGLLVCEPYDENGQEGNRPLMLVPIRHIAGYGETMWCPVYLNGERVSEGEPMWTAEPSGPVDGVKMLGILAKFTGHNMRESLRDAV